MKRWLVILPLSLLVTLSLFQVMAWMVTKPQLDKPVLTTPLTLNLMDEPQEEAITRRQRNLPEPPPEPQQAPTLSVASVTPTPSPAAPSITTPEINLEVAVDGLAISPLQPVQVAAPAAPVQPSAPTQVGQGNRDVMPTRRVNPKYPTRALRRGIEGYVLLKYDIDTDGRPDNIQVVEAQPPRVFEREARRALSRWKYQPKKIAGKTVVQHGLQTKIEFKLEK